MKFSNHTIIVKNYPHLGKHVAYNTRSQGMAEISQNLLSIIENFSQQPLVIQEHQAKIFNDLHAIGILVKDEEEDTARLKSHLQQVKNSVLKDSLFTTILTTYACNFKCTYCFQESSRTNVKMDVETSDQVMRWLKAQIEKFGYQELYLNFYGGEPLVNKPTLERIASHMQQWCQRRSIAFKFMMQTNGYLMTPELIERYLNLGLVHVRISVDGVDEDHDRYRPLRKGGGTFAVIAENIANCVDKVNIGISVSYDQGDIRHIERLLNYFENQGILHKLGRFLFAPIHATLGPKGQAEQIQNASCMCNYTNDSLVEANKKIRVLMERKGLAMDTGLSTSICPLTRNHSGTTIDQHGRLYKCNSMLGHPELAIGHVSEMDYNDQHKEFVSLDVWKQCPSDCTYMPICSGGCRLSSFLKNQNFRTPTCHKPYLNKMAPEFIKKEHQKLMGKEAVTV